VGGSTEGGNLQLDFCSVTLRTYGPKIVKGAHADCFDELDIRFQWVF
jgi:hypothetical protein